MFISVGHFGQCQRAILVAPRARVVCPEGKNSLPKVVGISGQQPPLLGLISSLTAISLILGYNVVFRKKNRSLYQTSPQTKRHFLSTSHQYNNIQYKYTTTFISSIFLTTVIFFHPSLPQQNLGLLSSTITDSSESVSRAPGYSRLL